MKPMNQSETQWDKLLMIKTTGRDDTHSDQYRYPYEPTAYTVLERLANSGLIRKNNTVLDYGTGKRGGYAFFFLIRPDADPSVWSMMSGFIRKRRQTDQQPYQAAVLLLY